MASNILKREKDEFPEQLIKRVLESVREDMIENKYLAEAMRVLPVAGYRSAIGCIWNAVIDDLRRKVMHRSLKLFNKASPQKRELKEYEDFQNLVNDDDLIDGAYKIGVIGWEASKVLKHCKEVRHIFDGHPDSSEPSLLKVLAMLDDCAKYVLQEPYPLEIIDIDEYLSTMATSEFDRSEIAIENSIGDLPAIYKNELINRLFTTYTNEQTPSDLRGNIEVVAPILWKVVSKENKLQIVRRVDQVMSKGNTRCTKLAFKFVRLMKASRYLSASARRYVIEPLLERLTNNLDNWGEENTAVKLLKPYSSLIPSDIISKYVSAITLTYVGKVGSSPQFSRTNFYANVAATHIPEMMASFDDEAAAAFVDCIKNNEILKRRIKNPDKLTRLRSLATVVLDRVSAAFPDKKILRNLVDPDREQEFWESLD
ncbi:hypothetical protein [Lacunimicrobium album]